MKSNVQWKWLTECQETFEYAKSQLTSAPVLAHYDVKRKIKLAADASAYGLGAVISHVFEDESERPIAYASCTLSNAEKHYAQIDKEALALVFAVQKFHTYFYGLKFVLVTDHKPLVTLLGLNNAIPPLAAAQLQRWAIILAAYLYEIEYKSTQNHANADSLSRLPLKVTDNSIDEVTISNIAQVEAMPVTAQKVATSTQRDPLLSQVYRYTQLGWPTEVDGVLLPFWNRRTELSLETGWLLWGIQVVIPEKLQKQMLEELHKDHSGIMCMKAISRSYIWWEGVDKDIESLVKSCQACQSVKNSPLNAPLHPWLQPTKPWQHLHIKTHGSESRGQEEAACMRVFWSTRPLQ